MKAIAIIQDEHRAITAVIEGLRQLVAGIAAGRTTPDHTVLAALFHYIEQFPERLHHPKEDDYLFARLRLRRPDAAPLLDGLHREHAIGRERFAELKAKWERYRADPAALPPFDEGVERYAHFHWLHMRKEEEEVLPLAAAIAPAGGLGRDRRGVRVEQRSGRRHPREQGVPGAVSPPRGDHAATARRRAGAPPPR